VRKKGGESGEAGVGGDDFFRGRFGGNGGGIFIVWNHFLIKANKAQFIGTDTVNSPFK
jgi:hypothetical protein